MHDPLKLLCGLKWPFKTSWMDRGAYAVILWHRDPCFDGTDDFCDWFHREFEVDESMAMLKYYNLNQHEFAGDRQAAFSTIKYIWRLTRETVGARPWWKHPKWHFWHWRLSFPILTAIRRWWRGHHDQTGTYSAS